MTLERAGALELLRRMVLIRRFEATCAEAYGAGKIRGFLHLYDGEEAVAVGSLSALAPEDNVVATYREHAHAIVRGTPLGTILAEMFGKATGCSRGHGGSMHLFDAGRRLFGGNAIVAAGLPLSVGLALADARLRRRAVTACYFGDGAVAEGEFQESLNLAALWKLPVLFLCENNRYAMGTALSRHQATTDLCAQPRAHGIPAESVDGMDVVLVREATERAAAAIRETPGPRFLEFRTYRFRAHSMYDAELYRSKDEVRDWMANHDPIRTFEAWLRERQWLTDDARAEIDASIAAEIATALAEAEAAPLEPLERLTADVYAEPTP
ncbi:MAG TPA: pyruvate dehydrogenase (acetyl-transferring) E1 component subunit alpha [Polyangiaceae bacterium]|nr:pyruvate dehydrogenase (acetyl-transferring) E1 component subunit alpha [Polyangiaceae bacterium]